MPVYMEHTHQSASIEDNFTHEQETEDPTTPPSTVLVQWNKELLLLDAWNEEGDKLRTPPSLIGEALKHFRIGKREDIDNYRLAVHELVDGRPALLFLGLTALRFIENGRVLELIDTRASNTSKPGSPVPSRSVSPSTRPDESATETFATAPLAHEHIDVSSDLSTVTSSESDTSYEEDYDYRQNPEKLSPRTIFFIQGAKQAKKQRERELAQTRDGTLIRDESDTTLAGNSHDDAEVYVHPQHGAVFRRRVKRITRTQAAHRDPLTYGDLKRESSDAALASTHLEDVATSIPATATYDFRDHHTLPRPVLSRPSTPSVIDVPFTSPREEAPTYPKATTSSQPVSRQSSVAHSLSRLAGRPRQPRNQDDDAWLSSDSREKWKNVVPDRSRLASRNRSFDKVRRADSDDQRGHARPPHLPRSQSHVGFSQVRLPELRRPPSTRKQRDEHS